MGDVDLRLGDCLDVMRSMPDGCIDLTVTSPPYDNLRTYNGFTFDFEGIARELNRVTKPGGVVVWVVADATVKGSETGTSFRQALYFKDVCGFNLHDTMIWRKTNPPPQTRVGRRYTLAYEYMFVLSKGRPSAFNEIRIPCKLSGARSGTVTQKSADGRPRALRMAARAGRVVNETKPAHNVWEAPVGRCRDHPAAFPEQLAADHITSWSNPGDTVLDPFMGSGTTGKMAALMSRKFVGIDISAEYVDLARQRIAAAVTPHRHPAGMKSSP